MANQLTIKERIENLDDGDEIIQMLNWIHDEISKEIECKQNSGDEIGEDLTAKWYAIGEAIEHISEVREVLTDILANFFRKEGEVIH